MSPAAHSSDHRFQPWVGQNVGGIVIDLKMHAGVANKQVRLVGGNAAPGGEWEYGRVEVLVDALWSAIDDNDYFGDIFGRDEAQVTCRELGFAAGAQLLAGEASALPPPSALPVAVERVQCVGSEATLAECELRMVAEVDDTLRVPSRLTIANGDVAVLCTTPSGASPLSFTLWY